MSGTLLSFTLLFAGILIASGVTLWREMWSCHERTGPESVSSRSGNRFAVRDAWKQRSIAAHWVHSA